MDIQQKLDHYLRVPVKGKIITCSGKLFSLLQPDPADICVGDIAHSLSNSCRWGGHSRHFFSVAEHSVMVSKLVRPEYALWGLLHDAAEAYLVDLPRPVKLLMPNYQEMEAKIMLAVCVHFRIDPQEPLEVKEADARLLTDEAHALGMYPEVWGENLMEPWNVELELLSPAIAKERFLQRYNEIIQLNF